MYLLPITFITEGLSYPSIHLYHYVYVGGGLPTSKRIFLALGSCLTEASPTSSILQTLAPADAAEAEAFQRRFNALRQKTELPKAGTRAFGEVGRCRKHPQVLEKIAGQPFEIEQFFKCGGG